MSDTVNNDIHVYTCLYIRIIVCLHTVVRAMQDYTFLYPLSLHTLLLKVYDIAFWNCALTFVHYIVCLEPEGCY